MSEPMSCAVDGSPKFQSIPPHAWGRDHLGTLLHVEARVVDHQGVLDHIKMRCDLKRHPLFAAYRQPDGGRYPTVLHDGSLVKCHDDYDCLLDLADFGLVKIIAPDDESLWRVATGKPGPRQTIDIAAPSAVCVALTDSGWEVVAALRKHYAITGALHTFELKYEVLTP